MPDFNLPLSASQRARVATAFAFLNKDEPATPAQVVVWLNRQLFAKVVQHEQAQANRASDAAIQEALKGEGW